MLQNFRAKITTTSLFVAASILATAFVLRNSLLIVDSTTKHDMARVQLLSVGHAFCGYKDACNSFPEALEDVTNHWWTEGVVGMKDSACARSAKILDKQLRRPDPWGRLLIVNYSQKPSITTLGSAGEPGGTDHNTDITEDVDCLRYKAATESRGLLPE